MTDSRVSITGIGLVGGFGQGKSSLLEALGTGGKPNGTVSVESPSGHHELPAYQVDLSGVRGFAAPAALRRMNRFAKIAVLGASLALEDAGWDKPVKRNDVGLVIASGFGASKSTFDFLDTMIEEDGHFPSPTLFSNSVHSSAASHLSILLELGGPCLTVSQFEMSTLSALLTARQWLLEGRVEAVLFGAVDEICPVLGYCYERFFGAETGGPIEPFAWDRQTAVMAEGAAFLLLERTEDNRPAYGSIDQLTWAQSRRYNVSRDSSLVLGADGQTCYAEHYRRVSENAGDRVAYTPLYGSLPGGQAFDIAIAAIAAEQGLGRQDVCCVKCDAWGNCGGVQCHFDRQERSPAG